LQRQAQQRVRRGAHVASGGQGYRRVAVKALDTATRAGSLFGLAPIPYGRGIYFVDDGDNTLKSLAAP